MRRATYIELVVEMQGLGVGDAVAAAADIRISLALGVAELGKHLYPVAVAAGELRRRSLGVLAASRVVGLAPALGLEILLLFVVGELIRTLPLLVNAAHEPDRKSSC